MTTAIVCRLTNHAGFFSVFFFLCKAYIYAKKNGYDFFIEHSNWTYYYEKGWHDYFVSLDVFDDNINKDKYNEIIYYGHPFAVQNFYNNKITLCNYTIQDFIECIHEIFKLKEELIDKANNIISSMNNEYSSIFIRRGDKITTGESPYLDTQTILSLTSVNKYKNIFVQSDTYNSILEVKNLLPNNSIHYTVHEEKNGSFHNDYKVITKSKLKEYTDEMLIGLYICTQSNECWTDDYTNVGRFLKLYNINTIKLYPLNINDKNIGFYLNNDIDTSQLISSCPAYSILNNSLIKKENTKDINTKQLQIDAILYINLEHRVDRNDHIKNELKKLCTDETKIHRINAIYKPDNGPLGCSMSHLKALNYILEHEEWNNCLILEDDFTFKSDNLEENNNVISKFFTNFPHYDCCVLSYNPWNARFENTHIDNIKKTHYSQTASSYLISRKFLPTLIQNFKDGILDFMTNGNKCYNCLDIYWTRLQPISKWYMCIPALGYQYDSYSDNEKKFVAYRC